MNIGAQITVGGELQDFADIDDKGTGDRRRVDALRAVLAATATVASTVLVWAAVLVAFGLLSWRDAGAAAARGTDVYLFLIGMMLLAEVSRQEGLFDWLARRATALAGGPDRVSGDRT